MNAWPSSLPSSWYRTMFGWRRCETILRLVEEHRQKLLVPRELLANPLDGDELAVVAPGDVDRGHPPVGDLGEHLVPAELAPGRRAGALGRRSLSAERTKGRDCLNRRTMRPSMNKLTWALALLPSSPPLGCKDQAKESAARAGQNAADLAALVDKDLGEIERGLPEGAKRLAPLVANGADPRQDVAGVRKALQRVRRDVHGPVDRQVDVLRARRRERRRHPQRPGRGRDGGAEPLHGVPRADEGEDRVHDDDRGLPQRVDARTARTRTGSRACP